jgi:alkylation response protein AidB-like acyl-CoA dehydrogenase
VARRALRLGARLPLWPSTDHLLPADVFDEIAAEAEAADTTGRISDGALDRLRGVGYFGLPVPVGYGGSGAGLLECAAVQRRLAMADPALAVAANMHLFSLGLAVEHSLRRNDACVLLLEAIATQSRIVASAFAEPGLGGTILRSTSRARRTDGGYVVSGTKTPCSLAAQCDLVCFQMEADPPEPEGLMIALLPATTEGVRVEPTWDALGMRASGSDTLLLENCFVPDELVFHRTRPGHDADPVFAAGMVWFCLLTTATYLGVVQAALDAVGEALRSSRVTYLDAARADLPTIQGLLGDRVAEILALDAACTGLARAVDLREGEAGELVPAAVAIKHVAVAACIAAVEDSAELVGGRSYARAGTLARLWRDVQAIRFHPPTRPASRQLLGRWALGQPFVYELSEQPAPENGHR